jgi:hypothetical protein
VGGALAVAGVVMIIVGNSRSKRERVVSLLPGIGSKTIGATLSWEF